MAPEGLWVAQDSPLFLFAAGLMGVLSRSLWVSLFAPLVAPGLVIQSYLTTTGHRLIQILVTQLSVLQNYVNTYLFKNYKNT